MKTVDQLLNDSSAEPKDILFIKLAIFLEVCTGILEMVKPVIKKSVDDEIGRPLR